MPASVGSWRPKIACYGLGMRHLPLVSAVCLVLFVPLSACDDSKSPPRDGGDDDASADAANDGDAQSECTGSVTATIGEAGGELLLCGARLIVPAGVVSDPTEFGIELAETPAPPPPDVLAGQAFRFTPDSAALPGDVEVELPHDGGPSRIGLMRLVEGELYGIEPCRVEDDVIAQQVSFLGVFVAVRDPNVYPEGPGGLGEGSITYEVDEANYVGDVAGGGGLKGYVIDEAPTDETKSITAVFRATKGETLVQVDLRFFIDAEGDIQVVQIAWIDVDSVQSGDWVSAIHSPDEVTQNLGYEDGTLSGDLSATLHYGDVTYTFSGTFTATAVKFRFPGELSCGVIEG